MSLLVGVNGALRLALCAMISTFSLGGCAQRLPGPRLPPPKDVACVAPPDSGVKSPLDQLVARYVTNALDHILEVPAGLVGPLAHDAPNGNHDHEAHLDVLVLSGGGLKGAFGAGVLQGWLETGNRPRFDIVTGVSTGALQSPFIFVDSPASNRMLRKAYNSFSTSDIVCQRPIVSMPFSDSLYDTTGLSNLIDRIVTNDLIDQVAQASEFRPDGTPGRLLLVGTANFDTGASRVWNLSLLAQKCRTCPRLYDRFRRILMASSAIPVLMSPVMIDGRMHADGGTREQAFVPRVLHVVREEVRSQWVKRNKWDLPGSRPGETLTADAQREIQSVLPHVYVIVNGSLGVQPQLVEPNLFDIVTRSYDLITDEALIGNLWRIHGTLQQALMEIPPCEECFNLIWLPPSMLPKGMLSIQLTLKQMRKLYKIGLGLGHGLDAGWCHNVDNLAPVEQGH